MTTTATNATIEHVFIPWWAILIEGIFSLIVGILLLTDPLATTLVIVQFLGILWLVTGVMSIVGIFMDKSMWGWKLVSGIIGIFAGLAVMQHPIFSAFLVPTVLVTIMGINGLIIGVIGLVGAFKGGGWAAGILGVLSLIFGILLLGSPFIAGLALPWVYGVMALAGGILAIFAAFRQRRTEKE